MIQEKAKGLDPRAYLALLLAAAAAGMLAASETALLALFAVSLLFQFIGHNAEKIPGYLFGYAVLWGISRLGVFALERNPTVSVAISLINLGLACRRGMVPLLFAVLLSRVPVGSFMAALNAMKLPKHFSIGAAILLRFFPTIGKEFRCIRNAQKFRGIGVGFFDTLFHLPRVIRYLLIPLIIRITRISEELSASVTVRGMRFDTEVISLRRIQFTGKDGLFTLAGTAAFLLITGAVK